MLYENENTSEAENENTEAVFVLISTNGYEFQLSEVLYVNRRLDCNGLVLVEVEEEFSAIMKQFHLLNEAKEEQLLIQIPQKTVRKTRPNPSTKKGSPRAPSKPRTADLEGLLRQKENRKLSYENFDEWSKRFMGVISTRLDSLISRKQDIMNYNRTRRLKESPLTKRKKEILTQMKQLKAEQIEEISQNILKIHKTPDGKYQVDLTKTTKAVVDELERSVTKYREDNIKHLFTAFNKESNTSLLQQSVPLKVANPLARNGFSFSSLSSSSLSLSSSSDSSLTDDDKFFDNTNFSFKKNSRKENNANDKESFFDNYPTSTSEVSHD